MTFSNEDGAEIGVESARTVAKCGNENCWLSWQPDVETSYYNIDCRCSLCAVGIAIDCIFLLMPNRSGGLKIIDGLLTNSPEYGISFFKTLSALIKAMLASLLH